MAMPLYCFNHLFGAILMSFTDPRIYNFIFNKMLSLKWLWFYQTLPFDIFWYVCKHQQISVYIVHISMLFILLPCIYSQTLAHVATVTCWLYPTLNKFYLILSFLIFIHTAKRSGIQSIFCDFRHATTSSLGTHSRFSHSMQRPISCLP